VVTEQHNSHDLQRLFQSCFLRSHNTVLEGGASEPLYSPAGTTQKHHTIRFSHDYYASALHEIAHWLVAGPQRRLQEDYGYWYAPDGRTEQQQREFERMEVNPQALEWLLAKAAGFRFRVSADNLLEGLAASESFKHDIHRRALALCAGGLNDRAQTLITALADYYQSADALLPENFQLAEL